MYRSKVQRNYNFPVRTHLSLFQFLLLFYRAVSSVGLRIQSKINCRSHNLKYVYMHHTLKNSNIFDFVFVSSTQWHNRLNAMKIRAFVNHSFDSVPWIMILLSLCFAFLVIGDSWRVLFSICFSFCYFHKLKLSPKVNKYADTQCINVLWLIQWKEK